MTLYEYNSRKLPEYSPTMYIDGYKPYEIYTAFKQSMREAVQQEEEPQNVKVVSEVKIR